MQQLRNEGKLPQSDLQFEEWLSRKQELQKRMRQQQGETHRQQGDTYQIPVVVHVIHNGEPIGTGTNISDAQIYSQLEVINNDFKRLNADASNTPALFQPVAGSIDIEFVLAKSDPNGLCTTGIVRVQGSKSSWSTLLDNITLKSHSYWPSQHYLNIWVTNLSGNTLGAAQFPVSTLEGLEAYQNGLAQTDGVVIDYEAFGSNDYGPFNLEPQYNKGRTATHEIGHFFGLRHIWGDATCGTDYVADTPRQTGNTSGCPSHPQTTVCGEPIIKMFQNYMDYTNDVCMNLFTAGQVERMEFILNEPTIPRRNSLLTSPGLTAPVNCDRIDVAINRIDSPSPISCATSAPLVVSIANLSDAPLNTVTFRYSVNGSATTTLVVPITPALETGLSRTLTLAPTVNLNAGLNTILVEVEEANGEPDDNPANSFMNATVLVDQSTDYIPLRQRFDVLNWSTVSTPNGTNWQLIPTNFGNSATVQAFTQGVVGEEVWLATPILDFSFTTKASMFYDIAYAFNQTDNDQFKILASTDCGATWPVTLISEYANQFYSELSATNWKPSTTGNWLIDRFVNLTDVIGEQQVRFAFVFTNARGNNVYLDNIEFFLDDSPTRVKADEPYSIYWNNNEATITFNLPERQPVGIYIVDAIGREFVNTTATDILNQTFTIDLGAAATGIYIMRIRAGNRFYASKFYLSR
ncbi:MAG: T9SS type A sorting domain-containing protein [Cyclobacteriaceae bacterium]|nr:T9SS type A sorting domain-containing protein [Cyclobacteriaceae bacterium]